MNILYKVTLRILSKNRLRTLVTIFGIILSAAMITAVTTSISSLQDFLVNVAIEQNGDWHGAAYDVVKTQIDGLNQLPEVHSYTSLQKIGYARLENLQNEYKPYLFVGGMSGNFTAMMPVKLTSGRLPENAAEIILPEHLQTNGGVRHSLGDTLSLATGSRIVDGHRLTQNTGFLSGEDGTKEELVVHQQRTYTVVGFYERPGFEDYMAPGYTALTVADGADQALYDVYIKLKQPRKIYGFLNANFSENGSTTHSDLLRFNGASNDQKFNAVLYGLAAILIALIMFGSISLIYNAFSISVSERTQQFGLLSSIGATRRQLTQSVLFEAAFLSVIGIPLGILAGIAGIGITLKLSSNFIISFLNTISGVELTLSVSWGAVIVAVVVGLVTVLISAYIPARRAVQVSAIDAIRQTSDITIEAKKVKTPRLIYKIFGFEGMIAIKNFNRNKKKYRATVLSLFMSVVLFISASSFCAYLVKSASSVMDQVAYDIVYRFTPEESGKTSLQELYRELSAVSGVTQAGYAYSQYETSKIAGEMINKDYIAYINARSGEEKQLPETIEIQTMLYFVEDSEYEAFLTENSLDKEGYLTSSSPKAAALDFVKIYDSSDERYYTFNLLNRDSLEINLRQYKAMEGYTPWNSETGDDGTEYVIFNNENGDQIKLKAAEAREEVRLQIGTVTERKPFGVDNNNSGITLIYPYSAMADIVHKHSEDVETTLYFKADDHKAVFDKISRALVEKGLITSELINIAERAESDRALISVINIFSYGFIVLISLIAAANVFNTISTNIGLRRREFAMLKSIGMTQKGFNKMMNFECLLYGFKGLVYGIPVSFGVTYLIYRSVLNGWETSFFVPWYSVAIAVGSVFAVVFSTMIFSMNKIKKDNPIDALRNENL